MNRSVSLQEKVGARGRPDTASDKRLRALLADLDKAGTPERKAAIRKSIQNEFYNG